MIRLTIFVIALLLAAGAVGPTGAWPVALAVLSGLELFRWRPFRSRMRPSRLRAWAGALDEEDW